MLLLTVRFFCSAPFLAMSNADFIQAHSDLLEFANSLKKEEDKFRSNNINFKKSNPLVQSLTFTWNGGTVSYMDLLTALGTQEELETHKEMLSFLVDQIDYRLRTRCTESNDFKTDVDGIYDIFKYVDNIKKAGMGFINIEPVDF